MRKQDICPEILEELYPDSWAALKGATNMFDENTTTEEVLQWAANNTQFVYNIKG